MSEPLLEPMHYWPPGGGRFACPVDAGFRSSSPDSVTCPACKPRAALDERRQRAREAAFDAPNGPASGDIEPAIETATRVRITHEIILAFIEAPDPPESDPDDIAEPLRAAFRAAGFEVEQ